MVTHHSITHFLSPNNDEISHSACLAPNTQLCFQHKKLKKLGPTHSELTCALDPLPGPINSIHQLNTSLYQITFFSISSRTLNAINGFRSSITHLRQCHQWCRCFLPPSSSLKPNPQQPLNVLPPSLNSILTLLVTSVKA